MLKRDEVRLTEAQRRELKEAARIYYPCPCGVHVCGADDVHNAAITIANIPTQSIDEARLVFEACREAEATADEPHDLVVDLNLGRCNLHEDDFSISRQMLDRCLAAGRRAIADQEPSP